MKVFDIEEDNSNLARSDKNITEEGPVVQSRIKLTQDECQFLIQSNS